MANSKNGEVKYNVGDTINLANNMTLYGVLKKETTEGDIIKVPDTGSFISIVDIILGIAIISGGGYTVYRKYKEKA